MTSPPCPVCRSTVNRVMDSRLSPKGARRRRQCPCGLRFTTIERTIPEDELAAAHEAELTLDLRPLAPHYAAAIGMIYDILRANSEQLANPADVQPTLARTPPPTRDPSLMEYPTDASL